MMSLHNSVEMIVLNHAHGGFLLYRKVCDSFASSQPDLKWLLPTITFGSGELITNNNKKFRSFKRKENIRKKEFGPYHGLVSDPYLAKGARGKYCEFANFNNGSRPKD